MDIQTVLSRLARVIRFDASVYREIAGDQNAMPGAVVVVVVAAIINALGALGQGVLAVVMSVIVALVAFAVYSAAAALVSKSMFQGRTGFSEMARTLGYTYVWQAIGILGAIPLLNVAVICLAPLAWIASIVSGVLALRESSEFDTTKAVVTMLIAAVLGFLVTACATGPMFATLGLGARQ